MNQNQTNGNNTIKQIWNKLTPFNRCDDDDENYVKTKIECGREIKNGPHKTISWIWSTFKNVFSIIIISSTLH